MAVGLVHASYKLSCSLYLMFSGGVQNLCNFSFTESFSSSSVLFSPSPALRTCLILTALLQQDGFSVCSVSTSGSPSGQVAAGSCIRWIQPQFGPDESQPGSSVSLKPYCRILCWMDFSLFTLYWTPETSLQWTGRGALEETVKQSPLLSIRSCFPPLHCLVSPFLHSIQWSHSKLRTGMIYLCTFYEYSNRCIIWYFDGI